MIVNVTTRARRQLDQITDYIARDNPARAVTFARELFDRCLSLHRQPERFPVAGRAGRRTMRKITHGNYLILYYVDQNRVEVTDIVNSAQDWVRLLPR